MLDRFKQRSHRLEHIDTGNYTAAEYEDCISELQFVNRWMGDAHSLKATLLREVESQSLKSFSILDIGAGSGELLRVAATWARRTHRHFSAVGLELNESMAESMLEESEQFDEISSVRGDALKLPFADSQFDYVMCSLFTHHLLDEQAIGSSAGGEASEMDLNSPWDLALKPGILIVAMAGPHQLWVIDLVNGQAYPYAGSGHEARQDGAVADAAFAQPSGLALDGGTLFVADAESNVIRAVELPPVNLVTTVAGGDLFEFGDVDEAGDRARFQHPLGVAVHEGLVYVADTYNHKVRVLDPRTRKVRTLAGDGISGAADGRAARARFAEPGGISAAGDRLFVADTNNHAIRTIEIASGEVTTLELVGLQPPSAWSYLTGRR